MPLIIIAILLRHRPSVHQPTRAALNRIPSGRFLIPIPVLPPPAAYLLQYTHCVHPQGQSEDAEPQGQVRALPGGGEATGGAQRQTAANHGGYRLPCLNPGRQDRTPQVAQSLYTSSSSYSSTSWSTTSHSPKNPLTNPAPHSTLTYRPRWSCHANCTG